MNAKFYLLWYVNSSYSIPLAITLSGYSSTMVRLDSSSSTSQMCHQSIQNCSI
jgi:hypothetical protein